MNTRSRRCSEKRSGMSTLAFYVPAGAGCSMAESVKFDDPGALSGMLSGVSFVRPSIMSTPGAEMSCSSQAACAARHQF